MTGRLSAAGMLAFLLIPNLPAQTSTSRQVLVVSPVKATARTHTKSSSLPATQQVEVSVRARLLQANAGASQDGQLMLKIVSQSSAPEKHDGFAVPTSLLIELPLSSSGDAYGESRACHVSKEGALTFVFTAGLDEKNFVRFSPAKDDREFRFLLNKYLCRAMAAPFRCSTATGTFARQLTAEDMEHWIVGTSTYVELGGGGSPARAEASAINLTSSGKIFDYAACEKIAPSGGLCCVGGKTTEWHCGGTPAGPGWHQVSGDCFHRETGGTCKD